MRWDDLDWNVLDRLREGFLTGTAAHGPYWRTHDDLAQYDLTYGERIGWKWDAVLNELKRRGWAPRPGSSGDTAGITVADWGCGSGVAGRRVIAAFGGIANLLVHDHSPRAREFAQRRSRESFPGLNVGELQPDSPLDVLVISHVLNELSPKSLQELQEVVSRAGQVIWVEPGTHAVSRQLAGVREQLRSTFRVVAPCTHRLQCGLLVPENARHWCHSFAAPPPSIYADSDWVKFGQRAGIDLRSLPYSFLVLERGTGPDTTGTSRILGDARHFKGYAKLLSCDENGLSDLTLQKRDDPVLFKALKTSAAVPVYRWRRDGDKIKDAHLAHPEL